jgi:hypothetical protein
LLTGMLAGDSVEQKRSRWRRSPAKTCGGRNRRRRSMASFRGAPARCTQRRGRRRRQVAPGHGGMKRGDSWTRIRWRASTVASDAAVEKEARGGEGSEGSNGSRGLRGGEGWSLSPPPLTHSAVVSSGVRRRPRRARRRRQRGRGQVSWARPRVR